MKRLTAAIGNRVQSQRRGRLLIWALQPSGCDVNRYQLLRDDPEDARRAGATMFKMPVFTGLFARQRTDHRLLPILTVTVALLTPIAIQHPFLYQRYGGQHDDVHQPDFSPRPSGSAPFWISAVRGILRNRSDLRVNVRSAIPAGLGDRLYYRTAVVYRLPHHFFHDGRRRER